MRLWRRKFGLALGGGSARGFAHLGILKVFEQEGIKPDIIVGTSFGALIGAAYASHQYSMTDLIEQFRNALFSDEFKELGIGLLSKEEYKSNIHFVNQLRKSINKIRFYHALLNKKYIIENDKLENLIRSLLPDIQIEDLPIKFGAVALDLKKQEEFILDKGSLIKSVLASSCIPGIFEPVKMNKAVLVDGGWINKVPVPFARALGAQKIIAVDVSNPYYKKLYYKSGLGLLRFADGITSNILKNYQILTADLVLTPIVRQVDWFDFSKYKKLIKYGENCALKNIKKIKRIYKRRLLF